MSGVLRPRRNGWALGLMGLWVLGCPDPDVPPSTADSDGQSTGVAGPSSSGSDGGTGNSTSTSAESTAEGTAAEASTGEALGCWDDLVPGDVEVFYEGFTDGSEGIAFGVDGLLYATTDGFVWRLQPDGTVTEYAQVPDALGLAAQADGGFIVMSIGVNAQPDGAIYRVDPEGTATEIATGIDSPNFVVLAIDGSAVVSDDFGTQVFRVTEAGDVEVVIADVPSPNGMAYSPAGDAFYVASTFEPEGQLTRYDVDGAGLPIEASAIEILHLGAGSTPDGIAVDEENRVYVAANLPGEIWRVDGDAPGLVEGERVAEGLGSPASIAFGLGEGFDPCSLYATQLFGDQILRVAVGARGAPLYH